MTKKVDVEKLRDNNPDYKALFWKVLRGKKPVSKLTPDEIEAIIRRVGYLDDKERKRFAPVLLRQNLTKEQYDRYAQLKTLDRYFPVEEGVDDGN